jgi:alkylhydroperoxidase family enzyme
MNHDTLSTKLFALIRLLVSEAHQCKYCIGLNSGILMQTHNMSLEDIARVKQTPETAPLDEKEKALLLFVIKAIDDSNSTTAEDVETLKQLGCSEREIFDALAQGARQVAGDIMLNAFKVEDDIH